MTKSKHNKKGMAIMPQHVSAFQPMPKPKVAPPAPPMTKKEMVRVLDASLRRAEGLYESIRDIEELGFIDSGSVETKFVATFIRIMDRSLKDGRYETVSYAFGVSRNHQAKLQTINEMVKFIKEHHKAKEEKPKLKKEKVVTHVPFGGTCTTSPFAGYGPTSDAIKAFKALREWERTHVPQGHGTPGRDKKRQR